MTRLPALLLLGAGAILAPAAALLRAAPEVQAAVPTVAETDASCAGCHRDIYDRYLKTTMANASGDAMQALVPGTFTHRDSGITYRVFERDGQAWLSYDRPGSTLHGEKQLALFVGANHRGRTYLFRTGSWWFEAPINYYSGASGYDMAPNLLHVKTMPFNFPVDAGCLHCHASSVQREQPGTLNLYSSLPFTQGGITCESCHGDTAAHVASGGKQAVVNPVKLSPERRDAVCYRCHLDGETNVIQPGRSPADYKPGDRLEDYVTYFIHKDAAGLTTRAVSEVEALNLSACKRASGDRLTCITCHDPHGEPPPEERASYYRARCLECHTAEKFVSLTAPHAHHPEQPDCTACHMPSAATKDIAHSETTDHRILRHPQKDSLPDAPLWARMPGLAVPLVPVPGTTASERDRAVATFNLIAEGDKDAPAQAKPLLEAARKQNPKDAQVLADLGWLAQYEGDRRKAASLFVDALDSDPQSIPAHTDLGVLFAQARDLGNAATQWRSVYARNPSITEVGTDLATIDCALGKREEALSTLERLLLFQPDDPGATRLLGQIKSGEHHCGN